MAVKARKRFGVTPLSDGRLYLYATAVVPAGTRSADPRAELRHRFGSWHDPIPALLDRVGRLDPAEVLQHDLYDLAAPLPHLHHGRIAWLGDAAHAMAPNLGQGGCQAIEDAVVLAHLVPAGDSADSTDSVPAALAAYTAARRDRTDAVRVRARRIGLLGALSNPLAVMARDLTVRATPDRLALRGMDDLFNGFRLPWVAGPRELLPKAAPPIPPTPPASTAITAASRDVPLAQVGPVAAGGVRLVLGGRDAPLATLDLLPAGGRDGVGGADGLEVDHGRGRHRATPVGRTRTFTQRW
ncbi:FAD-dependent monooxygenase [Streptomyces sp. NPDC058676]|uniref:FAD-dependent monooxygenase n=1 Tax=unclassified Streptomyces TaxID=2593676 RepID=UPI00365CAA5A